MKGKKTGGRKKGTPNKVTSITREVINGIAVGMYDKVMVDIGKLSPKDRVHVFLKLAEFNVSKPQNINLEFNQQTKVTIEHELQELAVDPNEEDEEQ